MHLVARNRSLNRLAAFTNCLIRGAGSSSAPGTKCKPMAPVGLGASLKSDALNSLAHAYQLGGSSTSASSSPTSGAGHKSPAYCSKPCGQQYSQQQQQQQQHYQQPPTADLLGAGYLCAGGPHLQAMHQLQHAGHLQQCPPIYHIAASNSSQTTRLIWNQGNGVSSDGFTIDGGAYMPLSGRSESGSVYQTIY